MQGDLKGSIKEHTRVYYFWRGFRVPLTKAQDADQDHKIKKFVPYTCLQPLKGISCFNFQHLAEVTTSSRPKESLRIETFSETE